MFLSKVGSPTPTKHTMYLVASIILGLLLSVLAHVAIEEVYLQAAADQGRVVIFYGNCALSPLLQAGLLLAGALGGYFLGRWWWRIVYIDRVWEKKIKH